LSIFPSLKGDGAHRSHRAMKPANIVIACVLGLLIGVVFGLVLPSLWSWLVG
jgi:hypothetical protein